MRYQDLPDHEFVKSDRFPAYAVNKLGEVWSYKSKIKLSPHKTRQGYVRLSLWRDKKCYSTHIAQLVLWTFVGDRPGPEYQAAHLNGDPADNRLVNLQWVTAQENNLHKVLHGTHWAGERHHRTKLTRQQVDVIRQIYRDKETGNPNLLPIAIAFGIDKNTVLGIVRHQIWRDDEDRLAELTHVRAQQGLPPLADLERIRSGAGEGEKK